MTIENLRVRDKETGTEYNAVRRIKPGTLNLYQVEGHKGMWTTAALLEKFEVVSERVKFPITEQVKEEFGEVMDIQDDFGYGKYGKPLDHTDDYDWLGMATEEIADALKYFQCEKNRKKDVVELLRKAIAEESFIPVFAALNLMTKQGTGK